MPTHLVIISNDKKKLIIALPRIIQKLKETNQRLNKKKTKIDTAYHGVPFLGKVSYPYGYQKPKKTTIIRIYQKAINIKYTDINNLLAKTNSQIGMLKRYNCRKLISNYARIVENRVNKIIYLDDERIKFNIKNMRNKKAQWALFISDPNIKEVQEIMKSNEDIEEAVVTVHKMTEDEKMRRIADLREKALLDEKAIRRKGYQDEISKGQDEAKEQIAKRMKKLNMSDEDICKILDITKEELAKLEL